MCSLVLDLQQEVLKLDCDILNALRRAHLIAVKLNLKDFDSWVTAELNGYDNNSDTIPEYRKLQGRLKAWNPYRGWIPVIFQDTEIQNLFCSIPLKYSIGNILELYNNSDDNIIISYPGMDKLLNEMSEVPIETYYGFHIHKHVFRSIIENVKNCLLEWTMKLEKEGILGEDMRFNMEETKMAEIIPQQINYYGTVINGDVDKSQVVSGDKNIVSFSYESAFDLITKIKESIESESLSEEDKESAIELIDEAEDKIKNQSKPGTIKAILSGLRDFLIAAGANVTGTLIGQFLKGM